MTDFEIGDKVYGKDGAIFGEITKIFENGVYVEFGEWWSRGLIFVPYEHLTKVAMIDI